MIEKEIMDNAIAATSTVSSAIIIKIAFSLILKGSIDDIWILFLTMQIVAYLNIYSTKIPAGASIYVEEFRNLVSFKALKPDFILDKIFNTD